MKEIKPVKKYKLTLLLVLSVLACGHLTQIVTPYIQATTATVFPNTMANALEPMEALISRSVNGDHYIVAKFLSGTSTNNVLATSRYNTLTNTLISSPIILFETSEEISIAPVENGANLFIAKRGNKVCFLGVGSTGNLEIRFEYNMNQVDPQFGGIFSIGVLNRASTHIWIDGFFQGERKVAVMKPFENDLVPGAFHPVLKYYRLRFTGGLVYTIFKVFTNNLDNSLLAYLGLSGQGTFCHFGGLNPVDSVGLQHTINATRCKSLQYTNTAIDTYAVQSSHSLNSYIIQQNSVANFFQWDVSSIGYNSFSMSLGGSFLNTQSPINSRGQGISISRENTEYAVFGMNAWVVVFNFRNSNYWSFLPENIDIPTTLSSFNVIFTDQSLDGRAVISVSAQNDSFKIKLWIKNLVNTQSIVGLENCTMPKGPSISDGCIICTAPFLLRSDYKCVAGPCLGPMLTPNHVCQQCYPGCRTCYGGQYYNCYTCDLTSPTPYLDNSQCLTACPLDWRYPEPVSFKCLSCSYPCLRCTGPLSTNCTMCYTGGWPPFLVNNTCLSACPDGTYQQLGTYNCINCHSECRTCNGMLNTQCTSCKLNGIFKFRMSGGTQCLENCPSNFYGDPIDGICKVCHAYCLECAGPQNNKCTGCDLTSILPHLYGTVCNPTCPSPLVPNPITLKCESDICHANCKTCDGLLETQCLSCHALPGTILLNLESKRCVDGCSQSFFTQAISNFCIPCHASCLTCSNSTPTSCTECRIPSAMPSFHQGQCIATCPVKFFPNPVTLVCEACHASCMTCSNNLANSCLSCDQNTPNKFLEASQCLLGCPEGKFVTSGTNVCALCHPSCRTCSNNLNTNCLACFSDLYLHQNQCITTCPPAFYNVPSSSIPQIHGTCASCFSNCLVCTNGNSCTQCNTSTFLQNNSCSSICWFNFYGNVPTRTCEVCNPACSGCNGPLNSQCLNCASGFSRDISSDPCISLCVSGGYLANPQDTICQACNSACGTRGIRSCTGGGSNECTVCGRNNFNNQQMYFQNGYCVTGCGDGFFQHTATLQCLLCHDSCKTCLGSSSVQCLSCYDLQFSLLPYLFNGRCVSSCPLGYYSFGNFCQQCDSVCQECSDYWICTKCNPENGLFLEGTTCVGQCPPGKYKNLETGICDICGLTCKGCTGPLGSQCDSCFPGKFLIGTQCLDSCPENQFMNTRLNQCESCPEICTSCSGGICQGCRNNLTLENGSCTSNCLEKFFYDGIGCLECASNCKTCLSSRSNCVSCLEEFTLTLDNAGPNKFCKQKCGVKQAWVKPNDCQACRPGCASCEDETLHCTKELTFNLEKNTETELIGKPSYDGPTHVIKLTFENEGKIWDQTELNQKQVTFKPEALEFKINGVIQPYVFFFSPEGQFLVQLRLDSSVKSGESYEVSASHVAPSIIAEFIPSLQPKIIYKLINTDSITFSFKTDVFISASDIATAEAASQAAGSANQATSYASSILAFLGVILSADQSGATLKFSQISKLISRLRMIDINYGDIFGKFLDQIGKAFDGEKKDADPLVNLKNYRRKLKFQNTFKRKSSAKVDMYAQTMFLFGTSRKNWDLVLMQRKEESDQIDEVIVQKNERKLETTTEVASAEKSVNIGQKIDNPIDWGAAMTEVKFWIYLVSWLLKFTGLFLVDRMKIKKTINLKIVKFINFQRKIHFLLINLVILDVVFTGTRSLIHVKIQRFVSFQITLTVIIFLLVVWDITEIGWISGHVLYKVGLHMEEQKKLNNKEISAKEELDSSKQAINKDLEVSTMENMSQAKKLTESTYPLRNAPLKHFYLEKDMIKNVMSVERAAKLGYIRVIDYDRNIDLVLENKAVTDHAVAELRKDRPQIFTQRTVIMANFLFILRLVWYHIVIISMPSNPVIQLCCLMLLEVSYFGLIVMNFFKLKYLLNAHLFISKVTQSFFMLTFQIVSMWIFFTSNKEVQPNRTIQLVGMWSIIVSVLCEYIFLIISVVLIIKVLIARRRGLGDKEVTLEEQLIYIWTRDHPEAIKALKTNKVAPLTHKEMSEKMDKVRVKIHAMPNKLVSDRSAVNSGQTESKETADPKDSLWHSRMLKLHAESQVDLDQIENRKKGETQEVDEQALMKRPLVFRKHLNQSQIPEKLTGKKRLEVKIPDTVTQSLGPVNPVDRNKWVFRNRKEGNYIQNIIKKEQGSLQELPDGGDKIKRKKDEKRMLHESQVVFPKDE